MQFIALVVIALLIALPVKAAETSVTFENDVLPILTRAGCNAGACHGKQRGQNGFQLSLLAFDPDFDFVALTQEARGRRVFPAAPERSLLLRKASAQNAHGGGRRISPGDGKYEVLLEWIRRGTPRKPAHAPVLARISVEPVERILQPKQDLPLKVTAHYSDGSTRDVTALSLYQSNESVLAAVSPDGVVKAGPLPGEAAIMSRFMDKFAVTQIVMPFPGKVDPVEYDQLPQDHFVDRLAWTKLKQLNLTPSPPADDATFLRRTYLDVIGRLPSVEEARSFLASVTVDKRGKLIDQLLDRPEYADYWANKWADLLRPNPYRVGMKSVHSIDAWLRQAFRENRPYDQFVKDLLTARGSTFRNGATVLFRDRREPDEITTAVSQLFLGVRLDCAKCHHHPFEIWGQDEFYSFAAYFARIGRKGTGLSPPISGSEEFVFAAKKDVRGGVKHPLSGKVMEAKPLFGKTAEVDEECDPRDVLADWVVSPENPYFARVIVNRVWADLMGRGIVEPVDDLRATNPPSNPALLDALAADFRKNGHDLKKLLRTIMTSRLYALSSIPNERNAGDLRNYSRYYRQRPRAEVLLDAISDITGVPENFSAMPPGGRATQLWTHRIQSLFLDSFSRPDPNQDPPCERAPDSSMVQVLHLMNAPNLHRKVTSDGGRAHALADSKKSAVEIVEELYLSVYTRFPAADEKAAALKLFEDSGRNRRQVVEDLMWGMLNTPEFVFKD